MASGKLATPPKFTIVDGVIGYLRRGFIGLPATPPEWGSADAGHGLARDIWAAVAVKPGQDAERLYALVTYYAKQAFVLCAKVRDGDSGRDAALAALMEHYMRARLVHQMVLAGEFLGASRLDDPRAQSNEDPIFDGLRAHPAVLSTLLTAETLEKCLPSDRVVAAAKGAPGAIHQTFLGQSVETPGAAASNKILHQLDAPRLVPERWGPELHDSLGVQAGLDALGRAMADGVAAAVASAELRKAAIDAGAALSPALDEAAVDRQLKELAAFLAMPYAEQTAFTAKHSFDKIKKSENWDQASELSAAQTAFLGLYVLNAQPANPNATPADRRTLRIGGLGKFMRLAEAGGGEAVAHPALDAPLRKIGAEATAFLGRQLDRRPISLTNLARARRDFQTLEFDILSSAQKDEIPNFADLSARLHASSVTSDETLIAMAIAESEIKVFEQVEGWMIEHLQPFLLSRNGVVGYAEKETAARACDTAVEQLMEKLDAANADLQAGLGDDARDGEPKFATPYMTLTHVDTARLAAAAARLLRKVAPEEAERSRKLLEDIRERALVNGETLYAYSHAFFHASLAAFRADSGEDIVKWARMAEQARIYSALLELLDTDFLHNESPQLLKELNEQILGRIRDAKRQPRTPPEATAFLRLGMVSMKIMRNNLVLNHFGFETPDGKTQIPVAPLALKDKENGDPVSVIQNLVALSEEVGKIHTRNVKSVNEQKFETYECHPVAAKLEEFLTKIGRTVRDVDGDIDVAHIAKDDAAIEGVADAA